MVEHCTVNLALVILHSAAPRKLISTVDLTGKGQYRHQGRQTRSVMNIEVGKKHHESIFFLTNLHIIFGYKLPFMTLYLDSVMYLKKLHCERK